jgi:hypothetical protein
MTTCKLAKSLQAGDVFTGMGCPEGRTVTSVRTLRALPDANVVVVVNYGDQDDLCAFAELAIVYLDR